MFSPDEYDSPWKDVLDLFFADAMAFFFPHASARIDWSRGIDFLDKELQKITADAALGRRTADKLVKVWLTTGEPLCILVHLEVQSQWEADFAKRVYVYHYRIYDRFELPVASFAILTDEYPGWRPTEHRAGPLGTNLHFEFPSAKLLDYAARTADLEQDPNPFAAVAQAHLAGLSTRNNPPARLQLKWRLTKQLYERSFDKRQIIGLYRFLDWVLNLPAELAIEFGSRLTAYEEERQVKYVTSIERHGIEKGMRAGIEKGSAGMAVRILQKRFGTLEESVQASINALSLEEVEHLGDALLDFATRDDLAAWLRQHPQPAVSASTPGSAAN